MTGKTYLVEEGPNPSTDYFLLPALDEQSNEVIRCNWRKLPTPQDIQDSTVIFVRYIPSNWRNLIASVSANKKHIPLKIIYFMDDDLFDTAVTRGQSWRYRYKLAHLAAWQQNWLAHVQAKYWVSSTWLQKKYQYLQPRLIQPKPITSIKKICRVFYHGSASHNHEINWLHPIMQQVLKDNENIAFEIIGDAKVNKLYRDLPRVNVIHPMKWPAYQAFIAMPGRHIGLAPMLESKFNQSRSYTKFFDITRAGAAGIYAEHGPWKGILTDKKNGLLIKADQEAWIDTILNLSKNEDLRKQITDQANVTMYELATNQTSAILRPTV